MLPNAEDRLGSRLSDQSDDNKGTIWASLSHCGNIAVEVTTSSVCTLSIWELCYLVVGATSNLIRTIIQFQDAAVLGPDRADRTSRV